MSDLDFSHLSPSDLDKALNGPALQPPPGVIPNFEHPGNKNTVALVALIICLVVSSTSLVIRAYVRFWKTRQQHVGDYLLFIAYLFYVVVIVGSLRRIADATGLFVHQWEMRGKDMADYLQIIFMGMCFWVATMMLVKSSILIEWIRIFAPTNTRTFFFRCCKALLVFNILFYAAIIVALNLTCFPYQRIWDKTIPGKCIDIKVVNLVATIINFVLDLAVLVLPQKIIWNLRLSPGKKFGISAVFAVGVFACIAAACLLEAIVEWILSDDMTYHYSSVALWAIAESTCGMLVFCVPAAPKAFRNLELSRRLSAIRSWVRIPMPKMTTQSRRGEGNTWPQTGLRSLKPRTYQSIDEPSAITLRPTDQQYGIICTTDIMVTESYEHNGAQTLHHKDHSWLSGVHESP